MAQVVELLPDTSTEYLKKATALYNANDLDQAYAVIDAELVKDPNDAQGLALASAVLRRAKKLPLAYALAKRATEIRPDRSEPWNAFAHAAQHLWRLDEAEQGYRMALQKCKTKNHRALYLNNLASVYIDRGEYKAAEPLCRESIDMVPDDKLARHNLGLILLSQHKWADGWPYYSGSVGTDNRRNIRYRPAGNEEPQWDGTKDKTIVIYGEQGLGDEVCAASMLPEVIRDSRKVIVDCDKRLEGLFRRSFPKAVVYGDRWNKQIRWKEKPEDLDASISAFEVGKYYRNANADFPGTPYLIPDPERVTMWKGLFATKRKPVIGIAWSGGTWHNAAMHRQLPLSEWKPIFSAVDAHWVSLQYKDAAEQVKGTPVTQYAYGTLTQDYDDTAALVAACDLVIAVQTSVNHLAGALGVPCWAMIPKVSQWRYGEGGDSIPWYGSMKLYRQTDQWPVQKIANDLKARFK